MILINRMIYRSVSPVHFSTSKENTLKEEKSRKKRRIKRKEDREAAHPSSDALSHTHTNTDTKCGPS